MERDHIASLVAGADPQKHTTDRTAGMVTTNTPNATKLLDFALSQNFVVTRDAEAIYSFCQRPRQLTTDHQLAQIHRRRRANGKQ
ncbi:hypothetical protein [Bradyrhizobium macuxiense]|nr:hypothetical protein [Bradyrhizobium macuxiense]